MVDIIQPLDFLGRMGGMANMPNLIGNADAVTQQREREAATIDTLRANAMANQAQAMQVAQEQARAQQFQAALATHLGDGSPQSTARLMTQFPEFAKQLSDAHALEKADIQEADTLQLNDIYARASNGDWAGAAANAKRRLDAEKAAGNDTTDEQDLYDALTSNDPVLQKRALGIVGMDLAARVGLDKFASVYGGVTTADGNIVNRGTGAVTYQGKPTARTPIKMDGGTDDFGNKLPDYLVDPETYQRIEVGGGVSASGGGNFERAHQFVASVEGGYAARDGKSGAPVNYGVNQAANPDVDVKSLTPDTAKQILHDRYWVPSGAAGISDPALATVVYDTAVNMGTGMAKAMLKASGGDVEKFLDAREKRYRAIGGPDLPGWLDRNEQLRAMVSGGSGAAPAGRERTQKELAFKYGAPPSGQILTQDGKRVRDPLATTGQKPLTEDQGKATGIYRIMREAVTTLNNIDGYNPTVLANALDKGDLTGTQLSQTERRALNAQRAFVVAALRLESGATYGPSEVVDKIRTLFPVPGDGPEVLADKARLRAEFIASARDRAGSGVAGIPPVSGKPKNAPKNPVTVNSPAEAAALAPGTLYRAPDGVVRRR